MSLQDYTDESGIVRLRARTKGGGTQPVTGAYSGAPVPINDGSGRALPFDSLNAGAELLDRTNPAAPTFLAAGVYLVQAAAVCLDPLTAGGFAALRIDLAVLGGASAVLVSNESRLVDAGWGSTAFTDVHTGDTLVVSVANHDGAAGHDFLLGEALITKLS